MQAPSHLFEHHHDDSFSVLGSSVFRDASERSRTQLISFRLISFACTWSIAWCRCHFAPDFTLRSVSASRERTPQRAWGDFQRRSPRPTTHYQLAPGHMKCCLFLLGSRVQSSMILSLAGVVHHQESLRCRRLEPDYCTVAAATTPFLTNCSLS